MFLHLSHPFLVPYVPYFMLIPIVIGLRMSITSQGAYKCILYLDDTWHKVGIMTENYALTMPK